MKQIVVVGGGAAGFFGAIAAAQACRKAGVAARVTILEKGVQVLTKVRISGGGRCNVTHACFDARALAARYPRGKRALISPFQRFQPRDTIAWFAERGVELKTEADGRMFPVTDSSQTIIDCLTREAERAGVILRTRCGVENIERDEHGRFLLRLSDGGMMVCDALLLATGGARSAGPKELAVMLGHTVEQPVPSLFTFNVETPWLRELPGVSVEEVAASVPGTKLRERGPLLVTHWGLSGPVILRLSAWGAKVLHRMEYRFAVQIQWLPNLNREAIGEALQTLRQKQPGATVANTPLRPLPARLWEQLVREAGISAETRWAVLPRNEQHRLADLLYRTELPVTGKSTHKAEFVTCGGVKLGEVNFKTMESKLVPNLHFAGEALDIDGITGGFNFQAAWTTSWIAGHAMAGITE